MTDLDSACLLRELVEYNRNGLMLTPQMTEFDTIFDCSLKHTIRALEERAGYGEGEVEYVRNESGSYTAVMKK